MFKIMANEKIFTICMKENAKSFFILMLYLPSSDYQVSSHTYLIK